MNVIQKFLINRKSEQPSLEALADKELAKGAPIELTLREDAEFCSYMSTQFYNSGTSNKPGTKIIGYVLSIGTEAKRIPASKVNEPLQRFIDISFTLAEPKDNHTGGMRVYQDAILRYRL